MPIKKDGTGKRWVEIEFLTPGTPEQVWQAMATGDGNAAWFTKAEIEERVGGVLRFDFGQGVLTSGEVTAWEPPHRFGYVEREWSEGAPPVATEITVVGRSGDRCVVRMVHSLFSSSDEWDDQMESFETGWPGFIEVLRVYLTNFAGMQGTSFQAMAPVKADHLPTWLRLLAELGLTASNVGEHKAGSSRPEPISGTVERVHQDTRQRYILLRLDGPAPGVALLGTYGTGASTNVSVCRFFYGDGAETLAAAAEPKWRDWLAATF